MFLAYLVITVILSLSICVAMKQQPLCTANNGWQQHPIKASTVCSVVAVTLSTLASIALIRWITTSSLLTIVLLQLATAFYLAHLACTAYPRQHITQQHQEKSAATSDSNVVSNTTLRAIVLSPPVICPLGILSLFVSGPYISFYQLLGIGLTHVAAVSTYTFIDCCLRRISTIEKLCALRLKTACFVLFISSVYIAWHSITHLY